MYQFQYTIYIRSSPVSFPRNFPSERLLSSELYMPYLSGVLEDVTCSDIVVFRLTIMMNHRKIQVAERTRLSTIRTLMLLSLLSSATCLVAGVAAFQQQPVKVFCRATRQILHPASETRALPLGSLVKSPLPSSSTPASSFSRMYSGRASSKLPLRMAEGNTGEKSSLWMLDLNTKGGVVVWTVLGIVIPLMLYQILTSVVGWDELEVGKWMGVGITLVAMLAWVSTYIFRVANKDMTYVRICIDNSAGICPYATEIVYSRLWALNGPR
jgi:type III secretory pathway component EscS